jgi:hypothetical protein
MCKNGVLKMFSNYLSMSCLKEEKLAHAQSGKRCSVHVNQSLKKERHWLSNEPTVKDELTRAQLLKTIVGGRCKDYNGVNVPLKK